MINFESAPLQVVRSVTQRGLAIHWQRLKRGRSLPRLSEFHPEERMHDSRNFAVVRVITLGGRNRFRVIRQGSWITEAYNADWVGKYLDAALPEVNRKAVLAAFDQCVATGRMIYMMATTTDCQGRPVTVERLLLPLAGDGSAVEFVAVSLQLISIEGAFMQRNILGASRSRLDYSVSVKIEMSST